MKSEDILAALDLPASTRMDQRVPKKLLVENGAPTAADKRRINEGIEAIHWLAALKSNTIGVPEFRDDIREYLEIAVLDAELRPGAPALRLLELIHRAVPYPVFLICVQGHELSLSLAHKRWSQGEAGVTILDGDPVIAVLSAVREAGIRKAFLNTLSISAQPRSDLYDLYQGWMDSLLAFLAARITGEFGLLIDREKAVARHEALRECSRLDAAIVRLRAAASKEKQLPRRVNLNLELKQMESKLAMEKEKL